MKIFAISVIKNEADIIAKNLQEASRWADKIIVLDNGSTDGSWEIVRSLASDKIVAWRQDSTPFQDGIRAQAYHAFKHLATDGDWWCFRLDADEIYADDPRVFLRAIPKRYHFVASDSIHFRLTHEDIAGDNLIRGIDDIRYHDKHTWSEARFFRHRDAMVWNAADVRPKHMGLLYPKRIKLKHYQYRSLAQLTQRIVVRAEARRQGYPGFEYAIDTALDSYIEDRAKLSYYKGGDEWEITGPLTPLYQRWYDVIIKTVLHRLGIYK